MSLGNRGGRKPKPTALRVLEGNPGKRPLNKSEPKPTAGVPRCPVWIKGEARAEWKRVIAAIGHTGIITHADRSMLAAYCSLWARYKAAAEAGDDLPISYLTHLRALAAEFGLTPSSRSRLHAEPPKDKDADEERYFFGT